MLNLILKRNDILQPLSQVQTIVDKKTVMTIINNVLLYVEEGDLYMEATDLEISYRTKIPCSIIESGSITINARKFYEIIKDFPVEDILLEEKENMWIKISSGENIQYKMAGLPVEDFPRFKNVSMDNYIEIDAEKFKEMIEKTIFATFATSSDETKHNLTGILFEQEKKDEENFIKLVSSDGNRLSFIKSPVSKGFNEDISFIIPRKGAQEIKKLIENKDQIILGKHDKFCYLIADNDQMIVRLLDARFPNYKKIIPTEKKRSIKFNRIEVLNSLKRISILSLNTDFKGIKAKVSNGSLLIESLDKEIGEAKELINIEYSGEPFSFSMNGSFLISFLSAMKSRDVELVYNDYKSPCILTGEEDKGFIGFIMPLTNIEE